MTTVTLTQVTDPVCTWCWGAEPILRRVQETYRDQVDLAFVMGGLVEDFDEFRDPANGVTDPEDVAPHWEEAAQHHGMPVDADVWRENPPQSTYPANRAYEAATLQGDALARRYLRRLREAVAVECRDVSDRSVLVSLADDVGLDVDRFRADLDGEAARRAFEEDRQFARESDAAGFPSFRIATGDDAVWVRGFRPYESLAAAIDQVAPGLKTHDPRPLPAFVEHYGRVATREVAEVYDAAPGRAMQLLRTLEDEGRVRSIRRGNGYFWEPAAGTDVDDVETDTATDGGGRPPTAGRACRPGEACPTDPDGGSSE